MAKSTDLAKLVVRLEAENSRLHRELERSQRKLAKFRKDTRAELNRIGKQFVTMAAAAGAALTAIYARNAQGIDRLAKQSDKLGLTTEALQGLRHAGELSGVAINTTDMALQRMTRRVSEAASGTGEARDALRELNLDAAALSQLSPDEQFLAIARAMEDVDNQGDRVRLAMRLFDSEGVSLVNTLAMGEQGIRDAMAELDDFGVALDRVDAAKVEAANDEFHRATVLVGAFGQQLAVEAAPLVAGLAEEFRKTAVEAGGFGKMAGKVVNFVSRGVAVMADGLHGIKLIFGGLQLAGGEFAVFTINQFEKVGQAAAKLASFIPGLSFSYEDTAFAAFAEQMRADLVLARDEFQSMLMDEIPSEQIEQWVDDTVGKVEESAKKKVGKLQPLQLPEPGKGNDKETYDEKLNDLSGFIGQRNSIIQQGLEEENSLLKLAFAAQQAAAIPSMIVATEEGATKALSLGPIVGPVLAGLIKGLGYASVGVVAGQTIASFEGGGFTGRGPRVGGLDGKSGFLAMLHRDEQIIDLRKQNPQSVSVHLHEDASRAGQVTQSADADGERIDVAVSAIIDRGGNRTSRAFERRYGVKRKGA